MPLTDTRLRNAKPAAKSYKLSDGGGMYLLVTPDGSRYWRMDYRFAARRRTLALGVYPTVTLATARARREEARAMLAQGIDPSVAKKASPTFSTRGLRQRFWWGEGVRKRVASKGRVGNSPVV
jgi:hypothetical protein